MGTGRVEYESRSYLNKEIRNNNMKKSTNAVEEGQQAYQEWRDNLLTDPEFRAIYEEEAAKKEIW
jgi:hypothetical protein